MSCVQIDRVLGVGTGKEAQEKETKPTAPARKRTITFAQDGAKKTAQKLTIDTSEGKHSRAGERTNVFGCPRSEDSDSISVKLVVGLRVRKLWIMDFATDGDKIRGFTTA